MIRLVDGDNHFRRTLERNASGSALRDLLQQVENSPFIEIWTWDGAHSLKRRREIYPLYKTRRTSASEDIYKSRELFQEVLMHTKAVQIRVPEYEGDDVIAGLVYQYGVEHVIRIQSNDKDLLQLAAIDNVHCARDPIPDVAPGEVRMWKALVGDPSDSIGGMPGFGHKAWANCNREMFQAWFDEFIKLDSVTDLESEFDIPKRCATWFRANEKELRAMYDIIGFFPPDPDLVSANSVPGVINPAAADQLLKRFYQ